MELRNGLQKATYHVVVPSLSHNFWAWEQCILGSDTLADLRADVLKIVNVSVIVLRHETIKLINVQNIDSSLSATTRYQGTGVVVLQLLVLDVVLTQKINITDHWTVSKMMLIFTHKAVGSSWMGHKQ